MSFRLQHNLDPLVRLRDHAAALLLQAQAAHDTGSGSQSEQSLADIRLAHARLQRRVDQVRRTLSS